MCINLGLQNLCGIEIRELYDVSLVRVNVFLSVNGVTKNED